MSIKVTTQTVTPEDARRWLDGQPLNRKLSQRKISGFVRQMAAGAWRLNGQDIIFDENGKLMDGQNRLHAVIKFGKPVEMTLKHGVLRATWDTIDTGGPRTVSDVIGVKGKKNAYLLSAALTFITRWHNGSNLLGNEKITPHEGLMMLKKYPGVEQHSIAISQAPKFMRRGLFLFLRWATFRVSEKSASAFWGQLETGEDMRKGSPAFALREKLIRGSTNGVSAGGALNLRYIMAYAIKAWNAHYAGRQLEGPRSLVFHDYKEEFPRIAGLEYSDGVDAAAEIESK